ncbi:MAG TPA: SBBP repeat-containing protein [Candidatus Kapabacteria bacterium]|nr:SBBP repeat-containing protein [Candidatus Kapabacteria bacterium]
MFKYHKYLIAIIFIFTFIQFNVYPNFYSQNIGQLKNQNNIYNDEVLYYFSSNNFKLQLKENGISYELYNVISEKDNNFDFKKVRNKYYSEKPLKNNSFISKKIQFARVDIELVGANIPNVLNNNTNNYPDEIVYSISNHNYSRLPKYTEIIYENIYNNIDLKFYFNNEGKPKYDFIVNPGGNPNDIIFKVNGTDDITLNKEDKTLNFNTSLGSIIEEIPEAYTTDNLITENKKQVNGHFKRIDQNTYGFVIRNYDKSSYLVIDPQIYWGTYLGGSDMDNAYGVISDESGNIYTAGETLSIDNIATQGAYQGEINGFIDAFIRKFDKNAQLVWSTYFGGENHDSAYGIACDSNNNIIITGYTMSETGIATDGTWQGNNNGGYGDAFIAKFSSDGEFLWGTYFGGSDYDCSNAITCDNLNNLIIIGYTASTDSIATPGSFLSSYQGYGDAFVAKFNSIGQLYWSSYFGFEDYDTGLSISTDSSNNIFLAGQTNSYMNIASEYSFQEEFGGFSDGFLAKFNSNGNRIWSTYYGGELDDACYSVKVDNLNNILIAGYTNSEIGIASTDAFQNEFAGFDDGFVAKFNNNGGRLWGTYYGGNDYDVIYSVCNNINDEVLISGFTLSQNNISTPSVHQENLAGYGYNTDGFIAKLDSAGERIWGTYYGGEQDEYVYSATNDVYNYFTIVGNTQSTDGISFNYSNQPELSNSSFDGFVAKFYNNTQEFDTLSLYLQSGWNTISSNIIPRNEAISAVFFPIRGNYLVVKNSEGLIYKPSEIINEFSIWKSEEAYQVFLNEPVALSIIGKRIVPEEHLLHLEEGWNWIPYIRSSDMSIALAFASINNFIKMIKDNEGNIYYPLYNLEGIGNLTIGRGYYIYITSSVDFYYPEN